MAETAPKSTHLPDIEPKTTGKLYTALELAAHRGDNESMAMEHNRLLAEAPVVDDPERPVATAAESGDDTVAEKSPSGGRKSNDRQGAGARKRRNQKRAGTDPRSDKTKSETQPEASAAEKWAVGFLTDEGEGYWFDEQNPHTLTRARLAEASVKVRRAALNRNSQAREKEFDSASEAYQQSRGDFITSKLDQLDQLCSDDKAQVPLNESPNATPQEMAQYREAINAIDLEYIERKHHLASLLSAREDGALMGEEANYSLQRDNAIWNQLSEKFGDLPRARQIVYGIGATALAGATLGAAGALAAGAGIVTKRYFAKQAKRGSAAPSDPDLRRTYAKHQEAVLAANTDQAKQIKTRSKGAQKPGPELQSVTAREHAKFYHATERRSTAEQAKSDKEQLSQEIVKGESDAGHRFGEDPQLVINHILKGNVLRSSSAKTNEAKPAYEAAAKIARAETRRKRKELRNIIGAMAIAGAAGAVFELAGDRLDLNLHGALRSHDHLNSESTPNITDAPSGESLRGTQQERIQAAMDRIKAAKAENLRLREAIQSASSPSETLSEATSGIGEAVSTISPAAERLYGNLAGQDIEVTIPAGSNLWDQLESLVSSSQPEVGSTRLQNIVGNLVNSARANNPEVDLSHLHPGDTLSLSLAA